MDTVFFLDLEETVIDSWGTARLVNTDRVCAFLRRFDVKLVHIFSFAVGNDDEVKEFRAKIQPRLENILEVKIGSCPHVVEMMAVDQHVTNTWFDGVTDFIVMRGKQGAFTSWTNVHFPQSHCVLVDDVVHDITIHNRRSGRNTHFVNVGTMEKFDAQIA